ncbi:MAG: cysteine peptidase family C39 domain-containing protein [Pirellulaceae bacterium]
MTAFSAIIAVLGHHWATNPRTARWLLFAILPSAVLFDRLLAHRLFWTQWLPESSAIIVWANATPLFLAAAYGISFRLNQPSQTRQRVFAACVGMMAVAATIAPIVRPYTRPIADMEETPNWVDGVCLQTHESTCGPAAAATLLRCYQFFTTEASMNAVCLTGADGTSSLGIYRGLYNVGDPRGYQPRVVCGSFDHFVQYGQFPSIVMVRFSEPPRDWRQSLITRVSRRGGQGHAIVVFGVNENGTLDVGDPATGRCQWNVERLRQSWDGEAIYLHGAPGLASNLIDKSTT